MVLTAIMLAAGPTHALDWNDLDHLRASDAELEQQRGGWISGSGLELSFGLEQLTVVDGELLHQRLVSSSCPGCQLDTVAGGVFLRNDATGMMLTEFAASGMLSILQNSLDNVQIGQVTVLNVGFSGGGMLGDLPVLRLLEAGVLDGLPTL